MIVALFLFILYILLNKNKRGREAPCKRVEMEDEDRHRWRPRVDWWIFIIVIFIFTISWLNLFVNNQLEHYWYTYSQFWWHTVMDESNRRLITEFYRGAILDQLEKIRSLNATVWSASVTVGLHVMMWRWWLWMHFGCLRIWVSEDSV